MTSLYTARTKFDKENNDGSLSWTDHIQWSKLTQLTELVSVDTSLNEVVFEPDRTSEFDWKEIVIEHYRETGFYKTFEYVVQKATTQQ